MKLNKGETIQAPVLASGVLSQAAYTVTVENLLEQGDHFYIYQGEDARGNYVILKVIRYRAENKGIFGSAPDYILYRRAALMAEHRLLALGHPCLPEPLAMLLIENNSSDDQRLFRKIAQWDSLRYQEPILIQEYFSGSPLTALTDKLALFSLERRLAMVRKVAKVCQHLNRNGYRAGNLHPSHILLQPRHDDNIYLVGLHDVIPRLDHVPKNIGEMLKKYQSAQSEFHSDLMGLGLLLYYLLTFHDPSPSGSWNPQEVSPPILHKEKGRLEKALRALDPGALWVGDLIWQLIAAGPDSRIPDMNTAITYLNCPPQGKVFFNVSQATPTKTEIAVSQIPDWASSLKVRLELVGKPDVFEKECVPATLLTLPGLGSGQMTCWMAAADGDKQLSWWETQKIAVFPDLNFKALTDLSPDQFGFTWDLSSEFHHATFFIYDRHNTRISLGDVTGAKTVLPPAGKELPFHEKMRGEAVFYFTTPTGLTQGPTIPYNIQLFPPIPVPDYQELPEGIRLELAKKAENYSDMELLHNGWPIGADSKRWSQNKNQPKVAFTLPWDQVDLFTSHQFNFRVLIPSLGWRNGPTVAFVPTPPAPANLQIAQTYFGAVDLAWDQVYHPQLSHYEIECEGEKAGTSKTNNYRLHIPLKSVAQSHHEEIGITVYAVYTTNSENKISAPAKIPLHIARLKQQFQGTTKYKVTPFFVKFHIRLDNYEALEHYQANLVIERRVVAPKEAVSVLPEIVAKGVLQPEIVLEDSQVEMGKTYHYRLFVAELDLYLSEQTVQIPAVTVQANLQKVGYESCLWEIRLPQATSAAIAGDMEIVREGPEKKSYSFKWKEDSEIYYFEDKPLTPGKTYSYWLVMPLYKQTTPYRIRMGEATTQQFEITETIQVFYNRATVTWTPSPAGQIECIDIYDHQGRQIGTARSDSINLENLEPERKYSFPLKYRYFSGWQSDGPVLSFTTLPYLAPVNATDAEMDSFRIRWEVPDVVLAHRIKEFILEVSGNVGSHHLNAHARSVQLKNLSPFTTYQWKLCGKFKNGLCTLGSGETTTQKPAFNSKVEVDLVHYLSWNFPPCPAIEKIEVCRDDTPIIQTAENEAYDSDFKGGHPVNYKFYYLLKDGQKMLAGEQSVQALSMKDLYAALKIEPAIGMIKWDFNDLRKFKYLKFIEMFSGSQSLFKQGSHLPSLSFEDNGHWDKENVTAPKNFQLAVVGAAPTTSKCKKKWVLNIKGIQFYYPDIPENFRYFAEHCCVYLEWEAMPTELVREIVVKRTTSGLVLYRGPNQAHTLRDDQQKQGLPPGVHEYTLELVYPHHRTTRFFEVEIPKKFDPTRLELESHLTEEGMLQWEWNTQLTTSISHIGCTIFKGGLGMSLGLTKLWKKIVWVNFAEGTLSVPLPAADPLYYQLHYQDRYGHTFAGDPEELAFEEPEEEESQSGKS